MSEFNDFGYIHITQFGNEGEPIGGLCNSGLESVGHSLVNQMSSYFIMQSDENKRKVIEYEEDHNWLSLEEIFSDLRLSKKDFTDMDYKYLTEVYL